MRQFYDVDDKCYSFYFILNSGNCPSSPWNFNSEYHKLEFFINDDCREPHFKEATVEEIALAFALER